MNRKPGSNGEKVSIIMGILRGDESAVAICTRRPPVLICKLCIILMKF